MVAALLVALAGDADIALKAGAWFASVEGDLQGSESGLTGSTLDVDNLLDLGGAAVPYGAARGPLFDRVSAVAEYWRVEFDGTAAFPAAQAYGGTVFPAGGVVSSDLSLSMATLGFEYTFDIPLTEDATMRLSPVGTMRWLHFRGELESGALREREAFSYFTPAFGVHIEIEAFDELRFDLGATWNSMNNLWHRRVDFVDGSMGVAWNFWEGAYLEAGYRYTSLDIRDRDSSGRGTNIDLTIDGPFVEMGWRF